MIERHTSHYLASAAPADLNVDRLEDLLSGQATHRVEAGGVVAYVTEQPWDTEVLGRRTWRVDGLFWDGEMGRLPEPVPLLQKLAALATSHSVRMMTARLGGHALALGQRFEADGWRLVDCLAVHLTDENGAPPRPRAEAAKLRPLEPGDGPRASRIAASALTGGRVRVDAEIEATAKQRYYQCLTRSLAGQIGAPGFFGAAAETEGRLVAFAIGAADEVYSKALGKRYGYLWLIAVDSAMRGQGWGSVLLEDFLASARSRLDWVEVSTQVTNTPALRLYGAAGLRAAGSLFTFHRHLPHPSRPPVAAGRKP